MAGYYYYSFLSCPAICFFGAYGGALFYFIFLTKDQLLRFSPRFAFLYVCSSLQCRFWRSGRTTPRTLPAWGTSPRRLRRARGDLTCLTRQEKKLSDGVNCVYCDSISIILSHTVRSPDLQALSVFYSAGVRAYVFCFRARQATVCRFVGVIAAGVISVRGGLGLGQRAVRFMARSRCCGGMRSTADECGVRRDKSCVHCPSPYPL